MPSRPPSARLSSINSGSHLETSSIVTACLCSAKYSYTLLYRSPKRERSWLASHWMCWWRGANESRANVILSWPVSFLSLKVRRINRRRLFGARPRSRFSIGPRIVSLLCGSLSAVFAQGAGAVRGRLQWKHGYPCCANWKRTRTPMLRHLRKLTERTLGKRLTKNGSTRQRATKNMMSGSNKREDEFSAKIVEGQSYPDHFYFHIRAAKARSS
jgi:hypothetical protein